MKRSYIFFNQAIIKLGLAALLCIGLACNWQEEPARPADLNPATLASIMPTAKSGLIQVYLLRGAHDVYSLGLDDLAIKMMNKGIPALPMSGPDWPTLAAAIEEAYSGGSWRGDLVFVGHSWGSDNAVRLAAELDQQGIPVRLLLLLDATDPPPIPKNVDRCVHYYLPFIFAELLPNQLPGNPVQAAPGNDHTEIVNQIVSVQTLGPGVADFDHFTIDSCDFLHQLMIEEVLKLTPSPP